jgi:hypothetical protein
MASGKGSPSILWLQSCNTRWQGMHAHNPSRQQGTAGLCTLRPQTRTVPPAFVLAASPKQPARHLERERESRGVSKDMGGGGGGSPSQGNGMHSPLPSERHVGCSARALPLWLPEGRVGAAAPPPPLTGAATAAGASTSRATAPGKNIGGTEDPQKRALPSSRHANSDKLRAFGK